MNNFSLSEATDSPILSPNIEYSRTTLLLQRTPLLIVSDYDGTLAPFCDNPHEATPDRQAWKSFLALGELSGVHLAILTGRSRSAIEQLTDFSDYGLIVGGHGAELPDEEIALTPEEQISHHQINTELSSITARFAGSFVEVKPFSLVMHYRVCDPAQEPDIIEEVTRLHTHYPHTYLLPGKKVIEIAIRQHTKADGISWLIEKTSAQAIFFAGDDKTDEQAFHWLKINRPHDSLTVRLGSTATEANATIDTIDDLTRLFHSFYRERKYHQHFHI